MARNTELKNYMVGIYCRLSKDDGTDEESASIATQKTILCDFVKQKGWTIYHIYVDDGYSGTNFERPNFKQMIKDIEAGKINCVITKDLSRLGRNYLDCGLYLEVFFPEHNVRYIAVNDGVDTCNKAAMDITPFRNILNEMYAADISVKIKSAKKARFFEGKFLGTSAPYGYQKDQNDHNHLVIDEKVAPVVRKIFALALEGNGLAKIRHYLNENKILRPAAYAVTQGTTSYEKFFEDNEENRYNWSENSVRQILRSPVYAGHLAGYKRVAVNMKSKKRPSTLPEEWEIVRNTHEAIVSQSDFDTVQRLMTSRRRSDVKSGFDNIFAGVLKCADCGYAMRITKAHRKDRDELIDCLQYSCNNYGRYGNVHCTSHTIEARDLYNAVLDDINYYAAFAMQEEKAIKTLQQKLTTIESGEVKNLEREKRKLTKRLAELDKLFSALYEDKVMDKITERNYLLMSGKFEAEQKELEERISVIDKELTAKGKSDADIRKFVSLIKNYNGLTALNATIVNTLIDKITVTERAKAEDGTIEQIITITYKFVGEILNDIHIKLRKVIPQIPHRTCTACGGEYLPASTAQKYCPVCSERIKRRQGTESKQRSRARQKDALITA